MYITCVTNANLSEEATLDTLTLLSWYIHRFWKSLVRHIFPATKLIAQTYSQLITKLPETLQYIYDPDWFPQNFINIPEIPSETIQKLSINHQNIEIKIYKAETHQFTCTNIPENTNCSLEASPTENMDTLIHPQHSETRMNETVERDFNSTLLDDGTLFSSHTVNSLIDLDENDQNNNQNNNNHVNNNSTINNTNNYQNNQHRQPVNSTELTQNSDPVNTTIPILPNINTPLSRLHRQNSVNFKNKPIILNNSTQPIQGTNQDNEITPQQLVYIVRQINAQNTQNTNAPTPYYLQAASTQTRSPAVRRNTPMIYPYLIGSVPVQQTLRPFDGTDPTNTTEDFLNAITANVVMTAGPKKTDSPFHEAWILKKIAMIQTALIGPAQQWYSHLPLDIKKNWQTFCREFQKTFDNQQSQTQAELLLESMTRASGEQIKTFALRIEQMTRKAYVNSAPDMPNAQMSDALVKALDPQLARIALKKIANHKSTALEPQFPFAQLVENIHQEDITRTHIDRHKLTTNSTFSTPINSFSLEIDNLTIEDVHAMEQDIAHGINVVRHKYSNDSSFKGKPFVFKILQKCSRSGHSISTRPEKGYTKPLDKPNFQKEAFNQAMKGNQHLPNRHITSHNMTGKPLPLPSRFLSNSRGHRNNSRRRRPNKFPQNISKPYYRNSNFKPPSRNGSPYPRLNFQSNTQINSKPQSPHYNRDGNRSRRPFSRNRLRNVRNYIISLLDPEQLDNDTSNNENENAETQNTSTRHFSNNNLTNFF